MTMEIVVDPQTKRKYTKGRLLGKGGFAKCYEFKDTSQNILAGKVVLKSGMSNKSNKEKLHQEIMIHRHLQHENVVAFVTCFEDGNSVYILLELCKNKTLLELHKRRITILEPEVRYYTRQIASGCHYIHSKKIIHRDLKLANIFLNDDMRVKLGDFGLATQLQHDDERRKTMCGTPNYIAPEILLKDGHGYAVDMWSLGCIIFTLLVGKPPFETESLRETYSRIKNNMYVIPGTVSLKGQDVIKGLLSENPKDRPTMKKLVDMPFFHEYTPSSLPLSTLATAPRFDNILSQQQLAAAAASVAAGPMFSIENTMEHNIISGNGLLTNVDVMTKVPAGPYGDQYNDINLVNTLIKQVTRVVEINKQITFDGVRSMLDHMEESEDPNLSPVYWVAKWVDYSDRYGLGYQLSDGSNGVVFNDLSRIILANNNSNIQYIEKDGIEHLHVLSKCPPKLQKKYTLLNYFQTYMNENLMTAGENMINGEKEAMIRLPFVKAWFRTKTAIVLYLSNGTVQINLFADHTKLILCPLMGAVTYIDGVTDFRTFKLENLQLNGCTEELHKRLSYAVKMMHKINASATDN